MLSDKDIARKLGKGIDINPFDKRNVEGASIYLTSSKLAWSSKTGACICKNNIIEILPNDTAIIITNEVVKLDKRYVATCHARLRLTMLGLSYYATPIKPGYCGKLIIVLQNNTDKKIDINVNEKIVAVIFYKLTSPPSFTKDRESSPDAYLFRNGKINMDDEQFAIYQSPNNANDIDNSKRYYEFRKKAPEIKSKLLAYGFSILFIISLLFIYFLPSDVYNKEVLQIIAPIIGGVAITSVIKLLDK